MKSSFNNYLLEEITKKEKQTTDKFFIPNPGTQEELFFNVLGCKQKENGSVIAQPYTGDKFAIYYRAGIGSGKTFSGAAFCLTRGEVYPDKTGLISANSYPQLRNSTLRGLAKFCDDYGIDLQPRKANYKETAKAIARIQSCTINGVWHDCLSAEAFTSRTEDSRESGRGTEYAWAWLDEFSYANESAFQVIQGRLRQSNMNPHILITSTINRNNPYNWTYKLFDAEERTPEQKKIFITLVGTTQENAQNLSPGYVERLKAGLTPEAFKLEVNSEYETSKDGKAFNYFDRKIHTVREDSLFNVDPRYPLYLSIDFNYNPTCAIAGQKIDGETLILKEWYLKNAGTYVLAKELVKWLKTQPKTKLYIHGDATGNQRTANSEQTNWEIVAKELSKNGIDFTTTYGKSNPNITDTLNVCNLCFISEELIINAANYELIKDLESLKEKDGGIDKSDPERSHLADCLRYLVYLLYSHKLIKPKKPTQSNRYLGDILY